MGRAYASCFAKAGARLSLCARTAADLESAAQEAVKRSSLGRDAVLTQILDITDRQGAVQWIRETVRRFGRIDVLINNAGLLGARAPLYDYPEDVWKSVMDANVNGLFWVTKACLKETMLKQGSGLIVNISSGVGRVGKPNWGAYAASKFALEGINQVLANELREKGIISIAFNPEGTRTKMRADAYPQEDPETLKTPEQLAEVLAKFIPRLTINDSGKSFDYKDIQ